jgi:hypothetical protein
MAQHRERIVGIDRPILSGLRIMTRHLMGFFDFSFREPSLRQFPERSTTRMRPRKSGRKIVLRRTAMGATINPF